MMQDQYVSIDEGLSFLDGYWELRVHISSPAAAETAPELADAAMQIYSEMRRRARAAVPIPTEGKRLVSAAFLVERTAWIEFVEHADDLGLAHPELSFDVTCPWPAYDFVHISPLHARGSRAAGASGAHLPLPCGGSARARDACAGAVRWPQADRLGRRTGTTGPPCTGQ